MLALSPLAGIFFAFPLLLCSLFLAFCSRPGLSSPHVFLATPPLIPVDLYIIFIFHTVELLHFSWLLSLFSGFERFFAVRLDEIE